MKNKKITFIASFLLVLTLIFTSIISIQALESTAAAEALTITLQVGSPTLSVNEDEISVDENGTFPLIENGRTLLPVRAVVEAMGGNVEWAGETQTTTLTLNADTIQLTNGSNLAFYNSEEHVLDAVPVIVNGRTMLPIRFIGESFGFSVEWDGNSIITLTKTRETITPNDVNENTEIMADTNRPELSDSQGTEGANILIVYFSKTGNTLGMAEEIQTYTGGEIIEIVPLEAYPENHEETVEIARRELDENYRPPLQTTIADMDQYDVIFLGYPIWWSTVPMAVATFLEDNDFSGKTIVPFSTHGGSRFGSSISDIRELCPDAELLEGLTISRDSLEQIPIEVPEWLNNIGIINE